MHPLSCCHRGKAPAARARGTISQTTTHSPMSTTVGSRSISSSMASRRASHISLPFFSARTLTVLTALVRGITRAASDEANVVSYTHTDKKSCYFTTNVRIHCIRCWLVQPCCARCLRSVANHRPRPKKMQALNKCAAHKKVFEFKV